MNAPSRGQYRQRPSGRREPGTEDLRNQCGWNPEVRARVERSSVLGFKGLGLTGESLLVGRDMFYSSKASFDFCVEDGVKGPEWQRGGWTGRGPLETVLPPGGAFSEPLPILIP